MKILSYNLCSGAVSTYDNLVRFINTEKPDILCLQEANGWNTGSPTRIEAFAKATGFDFWRFGDSNTDFKLLTLSRLPITDGQTITEGFWHCAVRVTVTVKGAPFTVWNVHLDPRAPTKRLFEAQRLTSHIDSSKRVIITGDLNSLGRADSYPKNLLNKLLAQGIKKFGTTRLSFKELDCFITAGLIDVAAQRQIPTTTVPTPANDDANHAIALRLDYILASPSVDSLIKSMSVVKNDLTDRISDHYPVAISIR